MSTGYGPGLLLGRGGSGYGAGPPLCLWCGQPAAQLDDERAPVNGDVGDLIERAARTTCCRRREYMHRLGRLGVPGYTAWWLVKKAEWRQARARGFR